MKSTTEIPNDLSTELAWQNLIKAIKPRDIKVTVKNGVVTLRGIVDSYSKKTAAEKAAELTPGVIAISNEIVVVPKDLGKSNDAEIADAIFLNLIQDPEVSEETFTMKVKNQWLFIEGEVEDSQGKKVNVEGRICKLAEKSSSPNAKEDETFVHATIPAREIAYWELFI